jgi:hypothetical protein
MRTSPLLCCFALLPLALAGCDKEEIRTERVPKPPPPPSTEVRVRAVVFGHPPEKPTELIFVKMHGLADEVKRQSEAFDGFVRSLEIGERIDWTLPAGWKESRSKPGPFAPLAAFSTGQGKIAPRVTISRPGKLSDLRENVNRWRRMDLGLPPLEAKDLKTEKIRAGQHVGDLVDMTGPGPKDEDEPPVRPGGKSGPVEYRLPEGWKDTGARGGMVPVLASFALPGGGARDEVTITQLGGDGGDVLGNVNRWRGQVGLPNVARAPEPAIVMVDGLKGRRFDFEGPEKTMSIVLVERGGRTWYFKLMASNAVASRSRSAFAAFLESVKFPGGKG